MLTWFFYNNNGSTVRLFMNSPMKSWWLRPCIVCDMGLEMPHLDTLEEWMSNLHMQPSIILSTINLFRHCSCECTFQFDHKRVFLKVFVVLRWFYKSHANLVFKIVFIAYSKTLFWHCWTESLLSLVLITCQPGLDIYWSFKPQWFNLFRKII